MPQGIFEVISQGIAMDEQASRLFAIPWEECLATDLHQLRADLGITPVLTVIRSWASNPAVAEALAQEAASAALAPSVTP